MARKTSEKLENPSDEMLLEQEMVSTPADDEVAENVADAYMDTAENTDHLTDADDAPAQLEEALPVDEGAPLADERFEEEPLGTEAVAEGAAVSLLQEAAPVGAAGDGGDGGDGVLPATETLASPPVEEPAAKAAKPRTPRKKAADKSTEEAEAAPKPKSARQAFYSLDFRSLDRDLSPEQEAEWNAIYASFRSKSILTGTVVGVDEHTFSIRGDDGQMQRRKVLSLVIISYRVKVLIPATEIWAVGEENTPYATRGMVGSKVDYVVMNVDRENDCAIASRRMALAKRRRSFAQHVRGDRELVKCDVLVVSPKLLLANCGGYDVVLTQRDLSYTAIADLRTAYKPGMELTARMMGVKDGKPMLSVKEVNPNPFEGADQRHPVGCRRQAVIEGKYAGGVFCRLPDDTTCLCLYSNNHFDGAFEAGDMVIIHITEFRYDRKLIYGRIVSKR